VWDLHTGKELERFKTPFTSVAHMHYSANGSLLAAGGVGGGVVVYRLPDPPK
jgi:hypothetical protein